MKIAVECKSPLLQKSLEIFLDKHLTIFSRCDIVIRDSKCLNDEKCFYIGSNMEADLLKPFSKAELILGLESKYEDLGLQRVPSRTVSSSASVEASLDFSILEQRIESLTKEYQSNIIRAVKAFYEK